MNQLDQMDRLKETLSDVWLLKKIMKIEQKLFDDLPWLEDLTLEQQDDLFQSVWEVIYQ